MKFKHVFLTQNFLLLFLTCWGQQHKKTEPSYPAIEQQNQSQVFFGIEVVDQYANLSNLDNDDVISWLNIQDSIAEAYFHSEDLYKDYLERFRDTESENNAAISMVRMSENGHYFYLKNHEITGVDKLYFRQNLEAPEIELFDPTLYGDITYLNPSWSGEYIAIGFDAGDGFSSKVYILEVDSKELFDNVLTNINPDFGGIEWLPDDSGFIYLYFPVVDQNKIGFKKNAYSVLQNLTDNFDRRFPIFGSTTNLKISPQFFPKVKIGSGENSYAIGYVANSNDFYDAYITQISDLKKGNPIWKPFFKEGHRVYFDQGEIRGNNFIFRQESEAGNRIGLTNIENPNFKAPFILAEGNKESPISKFAVTKDKIYYTRTRYGVEVSLYELDTLNGDIPINLPYIPGYLSFLDESQKNNELIIGIDGWTSDYARYIIKEAGIFREPLLEEPVLSKYEDLISKQIMVSSHDGEEVPLSLVYKKGIKMNSKNEVFIYVYGAYGENMSPFYSPIFLDWANRGGILAFPHVRGGGEKGKEWHKAGMKDLKYNSWKDLNSCVQALIDLGFTQKGLIALYTSSAGGITGGMAVNERPDLYSSFIAEVPRLHPFGLESSSTASSSSYLEYGSIKDSVEFMGLLNMDPYLNIKDGEYPATLIMPSYKDDRIPLWDSGKYIAKLQRVNKSGSTVLLDIDFENGHENYREFDDVVKQYSKIFFFAKSNMVK